VAIAGVLKSGAPSAAEVVQGIVQASMAQAPSGCGAFAGKAAGGDRCRRCSRRRC